MKNTKKIISLVLAICMLASLAISASAANTVDASGGTGTSSVTLSSTADGSIGGDPAATKMSVTVPTVLPIAVGTDGTVSTATDAKIVNNSFGAVKVIACDLIDEKLEVAKKMGADAVLICRPFVPMVYGGAEEGVKLYIEKIGAELSDTMAMCGAENLASINRDMVLVK